MANRKYNIIREFSEFNNMRMNSDTGGFMPNVDNPQLSIGAFDKHQDAIRSATSRVNNILKSLSNSPQFSILKSRLSMDEQNITSMKILRISKDSLNYNVYVQFVIAECEYWGVVEDILSEDPNFKSEVFKNTDLILTKEWIIKIKGLVVKIIKKWLNPENGIYKLLNDEAYCYNINNGKLLKINKDTKVEVIRSFDNKIVVKHDNDYYNIIGDSYVYFNYWFLKSLN